MNNLQKEFESTGYNSWVNSDLYPDGKIYTKEYTEWLEKKFDEVNSMMCIKKELQKPNLEIKPSKHE